MVEAKDEVEAEGDADPQTSSAWEERLLAVKVGLLCTVPDPFDIPPMTEVLFMLEGCRFALENIYSCSFYAMNL